MATYNLTSSIPNADDLRDGDIINCPYTGYYKMIKLPKGVYKLEVWGAQGGSASGGYAGAQGGYSYGTLTLKNKNKTRMYLYAGGRGVTCNGSEKNGGFNGGGSGRGHSSYSAGSGGGGSDIRIDSKSLYARVIVAGGGGGANSLYSAYNTGYGGGTSGGRCYYSSSNCGNGGSQTAAGTGYSTGSFGVGSTSTTSYVAGGGGGWYPGGNGTNVGGGGGSGYVYTSSSASNYPSGCLLDSNYYLTDASTAAGNTSFIDPESGSSTTGRYGNGYVRITCVEIYSGVYEKTESGWVKLYQDGLNILASNPYALIKKFILKISGEWSSVSTIPYIFYSSSAIVLNKEIHILGGGYNPKYHYKYNTSTNTWSSVSTLPYDFYFFGSAVVLDNEIHILGGAGNQSSPNYYNHYRCELPD